MTSALPLIAVVDDEEPVRKMLRRVLRLADYDVAEFECGEDFLASLGTRVPACVVLDVHMPGLGGLDVYVRMRATQGDVPALFITASADPALDNAVHNAHGAALLRKPFCSADLLNALALAIRSESRSVS